jgi:hypothetical protein
MILHSLNSYIPLQTIELTGGFYDFCESICVKAIFQNDYEEAVEAVYKFTLNSSSTINGF